MTAASSSLDRVNLLGLSKAELEGFVGELGSKPFRARQLMNWLYKRGESEPCTVLRSIPSARSARIVPGAAFFGSVAPMISRFFAMAFSPSSTCNSTGPEVMYFTRSLKNGRAACTA
jgi:hypothetical protein